MEERKYRSLFIYKILHKTPKLSLLQIIEVLIILIRFPLEADVAICFIMIAIDDEPQQILDEIP